MGNIKKYFIQSITEVLCMFGVETTFDSETCIERVQSSNQVNILIGIIAGCGGNMILGMDKPMALNLASKLMCGMEITELDNMSKSALGEISNMVMGKFISMLQKDDEIIDISPPTVVVGERVLILLSKTQAHRLWFTSDEHKYHFTFSIEQ